MRQFNWDKVFHLQEMRNLADCLVHMGNPLDHASGFLGIKINFWNAKQYKNKKIYIIHKKNVKTFVLSLNTFLAPSNKLPSLILCYFPDFKLSVSHFIIFHHLFFFIACLAIDSWLSTDRAPFLARTSKVFSCNCPKTIEFR